MSSLREGEVGILPPGALGVSLFFHLTNRLARLEGDVYFVPRAGSESAREIREGELRVARDGEVRRIRGRDVIRDGLRELSARGELPEVLVVCPNPDQLLGVISDCVLLIEDAEGRGALVAADLPLPDIVLSSNGIYYQRLRQFFVEKLEESTLMGRLPDLWPRLMPSIVGRLIRGVTIQTGVREGDGAGALYVPGPPGRTRLAGGDAERRKRCQGLLAGRGGWFEAAEESSATRLEFDKALVNLASNFLGQLVAINEHGAFRPCTVGEVVARTPEADLRVLTGHVVEVGRAVKAYRESDSAEKIFESLKQTLKLHAAHVPSSQQWLGLRLRTGTLSPRLTPTERWLIDPLIRYAHGAGLDDPAEYFEELKARLEEKLVRAASRQPGPKEIARR